MQREKDKKGDSDEKRRIQENNVTYEKACVFGTKITIRDKQILFEDIKNYLRCNIRVST